MKVRRTEDEQRKNGDPEVGARLKEVIALVGLKQREFATRVGAKTASGIADNISGKTMPGGRVLSVLGELGVNVNYVLNGTLPKLLPAEAAGMIRSDAPAPEAYTVQEPAPGVAVSNLRSAILRMVVETAPDASPEDHAILLSLGMDYVNAQGSLEPDRLRRFLIAMSSGRTEIDEARERRERREGPSTYPRLPFRRRRSTDE